MITFESQDYIAHIDSDIAIVWRRNDKLYVYSVDNGKLVDTIRNPDIEFLDDVDYTTAEYLEYYLEEKRAIQGALEL